jgi:glyoxylase-like metal-dependent hydrolase (beta-lactamase superfamily II)
MPAYICRTCGVQYPDSAAPPDLCVICSDPRQYVGWEGQRWTSLRELAAEGHRTEVRQEEPGLIGIGVEPAIGIGQRSLLVIGSGGNLLWDVPGFVDEAAFAVVAEHGGLSAVSASHPHFYGVICEWADRFDVPVVLPEADRRWLTRPPRHLELYRDRMTIGADIELVRCGGHFPGSAVVHWTGATHGAGVLLTGDTVTVVQDRSWVSFMWSYPNLIPLDERELDNIETALAPLDFERIYGGWWGRVVDGGASAVIRRSIERYRIAITDTSSLEP